MTEGGSEQSWSFWSMVGSFVVSISVSQLTVCWILRAWMILMVARIYLSPTIWMRSSHNLTSSQPDFRKTFGYMQHRTSEGETIWDGHWWKQALLVDELRLWTFACKYLIVALSWLLAASTFLNAGLTYKIVVPISPSHTHAHACTHAHTHTGLCQILSKDVMSCYK